MTRTAFWLAGISVLLCLSACSAPEDQSAQAPQPKPVLDPESYARHLDVCLAGEGGCNYAVLTREDRARVLAASGYGKEGSQKAEREESSDDGEKH